MKTKNMCKFVESSISDGLLIKNFVLETEKKIMERPSAIYAHRAILPLSGEGCFLINGVSYSFRPGTLVFVFQSETLSVSSKGSCQYIYITFSGGRADELFRRFGIHVGRRVFSGLDGCIPLWRESLLHATEGSVDLAAESALLYIFSRLEMEKNEKDDLVQRITALSEAYFNNPALSLSSIADELGYNAKYLSHAFKEKTGTSYTEYLRMLRLKYAVSLFEHGLDSVKNVSLLSGFSDPLYFSTVFKQTLGVSPKQFIARTGGEEEEE